MNDRAAFADLIFAVGEFYAESLSVTRVEMYYSALADLDLADIRAALNVHLQTSRFFPKPVEIREAINGSAEDRAEVAWNAVQKLVRSHGWIKSPQPEAWPDEATRRAAMDLYGGWVALCENLPAGGPEMLGTAKLFKANYAAYARSEARADALPPSPDEARKVLNDMKQQLVARGLPTGGL